MTWTNLGYQPHPWRAATRCTSAAVKAEGQNQQEGGGWAAQPAHCPPQSMLEGSG